MKFEWDDAKELANRRKHGISFEIASQVFKDLNPEISPAIGKRPYFVA
jgi:uncharacterized DUF497 family protein